MPYEERRRTICILSFWAILVLKSIDVWQKTFVYIMAFKL